MKPRRTMVTVSKPRCGCCGKPGHHVAVVHAPAVFALEVLADVAARSEAAGPELRRCPRGTRRRGARRRGTDRRSPTESRAAACRARRFHSWPCDSIAGREAVIVSERCRRRRESVPLLPPRRANGRRHARRPRRWLAARSPGTYRPARAGDRERPGSVKPWRATMRRAPSASSSSETPTTAKRGSAPVQRLNGRQRFDARRTMLGEKIDEHRAAAQRRRVHARTVERGAREIRRRFGEQGARARLAAPWAKNVHTPLLEQRHARAVATCRRVYGGGGFALSRACCIANWSCLRNPLSMSDHARTQHRAAILRRARVDVSPARCARSCLWPRAARPASSRRWRAPPKHRAIKRAVAWPPIKKILSSRSGRPPRKPTSRRDCAKDRSSSLTAAARCACSRAVRCAATTFGAGQRPSTDVIEIRNADELYAKMPLGAVSLEGELQRSGRIAVQTTASGQLQLANFEPTSVPKSPECEGATHVVGALSVGAFKLRSGGAARAGVAPTVSVDRRGRAALPTARKRSFAKPARRPVANSPPKRLLMRNARHRCRCFCSRSRSASSTAVPRAR